jgi:hypothetical protein
VEYAAKVRDAQLWNNKNAVPDAIDMIDDK